MSSKRQTTMAKMARERAVREKREKKREKKQAAALERAKAAEIARRVLVVTTADATEAEVESVVRAHVGEDAEVRVIAPASKISWLDRLTNAEDDARDDAADRAEAVSQAVPGEHAEADVGDVDPLQAIEDALRMFPAGEVVVLTAPGEEATWLEAGLGEEAQERFSVPVTHLVAR